MARLNETLVPTDNLELLRRKFLRQNRDIARINSTQSLKIRGLENECARMLSENLALHSRILHLETELENSRAHKIADHAMEIKEKMEAQFLEWGSMLASLGHEPMPKDCSPRLPKRAKTRASYNRPSLPKWNRRETMEEQEAMAFHEGRLAPIWEAKSYPRETLNREEILALYRDEANPNDSPDLGPPPVSRFVDEDPVKFDLPLRPTQEELENCPQAEVIASSSEQSTLALPAQDDELPQQPEVEATIQQVFQSNENLDAMQSIAQTDLAFESEKTKPSPKIERQVEVAPIVAPKNTKQATIVPTGQENQHAARNGLKRKTRDEDDKLSSAPLNPNVKTTQTAKIQPVKTANVKSRPVNRPIKELPTSKRENGETHVPAASVAPRKPLGTKSSNGSLNSSQKKSKAPASNEAVKPKSNPKRDDPAMDKQKPQKDMSTAPVEVVVPKSPLPEAVPVANIDIEPDTLSAEPNLAVPESPESTAPRDDLQDTPPPADISSTGQTSRGGRRARSAVSYAEPNLRDKMRRPTKQLFDAVAGEGKHMRRTSHSAKDDMPSIKSEERSASSWKTLPSAPNDDEHGRNDDEMDIAASPLAKKTSRSSTDDADMMAANIYGQPPSLDVKDQKRRSSAIILDESTTLKHTTHHLDDVAAREAEVARMFDGPEDDVQKTARRTGSSGSKKASGAGRGNNPKPRRLSSISREELAACFSSSMSASEEETLAFERKTASSRNSRKRASMAAAAPKKPKMRSFDDDTDDDDEPDDDGDGDYSDGVYTGKGTTSVTRRRRSMMV